MTARKIIVGYDRSSDAKAAAAWALDEAARTGALVEFFYAYEWPAWAPAASMVPSPAVWPDGETDRAIRDRLNDAVTSAKLSHPGVRTTISIVHGSAGTEPTRPLLSGEPHRARQPRAGRDRQSRISERRSQRARPLPGDRGAWRPGARRRPWSLAWTTPTAHSSP